MTQKKGGAVKSGGAKAVAGGHNVAKGGFQKAKAGALQSKAFLGKKELVPKGKAGSPQVGKQQQKAGARGNSQAARGGKNGKSVQAKKGKSNDDDDDEDEEEDEADIDFSDDEEDMDDDVDDDDDDDDDDEDEELSDDEENSVPTKKQQKQQSQPPKQAATPKSILKKTNTTPQADDEKVPKLVPISAKETPKGGQQAAKNGNAKQNAVKAATAASEKPMSTKEQKSNDDQFKLIANVDSEPLTAAQRGEFETRVKRFANATVFVKGLHRRVTEDDLRKLVKDVITIRLPVHEKRGSRGARSRGYAFLEFKDEATARRSVDFLNKEAQLVNSEGQPCKLEASVSAAGGYVMAADDWNVGSLYVSGIPSRATEEDLAKLFDRDQLVTVVLPRNRFTGATRGCAHIRFRSAEASIQQFDAARAKLLRGEFSINGQALTIAFSSRQTLKRERAEQTGKDNQKPAATDKKVAETSKPAPASQNQTPKSAAASNAGASATKAVAKATPNNAAANKSLNESVAKKGANDSIVKKQAATPVQNSAQKGATKRKLEEETARKAKIAKRDEEEDDDEDDDEDEDDDDEDDEEDDDDDDDDDE